MQAMLPYRRGWAINFDKASIGIGSMIILIAMILVASIAASIIINTSNTLKVQAFKTGQETEGEISSGIGVVQIIGQYGIRNIGGTDYSRFHNMSLMITSRAGGSGVNLGGVIITIANETKMCLLSWCNTFAAEASGNGVFSTGTCFDIGPDDFGIIVIEDADGSCTASNPVINRGDKAILTINLSACFNGLASKKDIRGIVMDEQGSPGVFLFRTPATCSKTVVEFM